jgi:hypothetical protein
MGEKQHKMMVFTSGIYIYPLSWEIKSLNPYLDTSHLSTVSYFVKFLFLLSLEHGEDGFKMRLITQNPETNSLGWARYHLKHMEERPFLILFYYFQFLYHLILSYPVLTSAFKF